MARRARTRGHEHVRVAGVRLGEARLGPGLVQVVELLGEPVAQLGDQRRQRQPARDEGRGPRPSRQGPDVGDQRLAHARVLDLHRDRPALGPRSPGAPGRSRRPPSRSARSTSSAAARPFRARPRSTGSTSANGSGALPSCSPDSVSRQVDSGSCGNSASTVDSSCPALRAPPLRSPRTRSRAGGVALAQRLRDRLAVLTGEPSHRALGGQRRGAGGQRDEPGGAGQASGGQRHRLSLPAAEGGTLSPGRAGRTAARRVRRPRAVTAVRTRPPCRLLTSTSGR